LLRNGTKAAARDIVDAMAESAQKAFLKRGLQAAGNEAKISIDVLSDGQFEWSSKGLGLTALSRSSRPLLPTAALRPFKQRLMRLAISYTMTQRTNLPKMTPGQLAALERYARLEIGIDDIRCALRGQVEFNFEPENRWIDQRFNIQKPGIVVTREHIQNALTKKRLGQVGERDLVYWASMLLMNDAYEFDSKDEDFIASWLNDISYNLDPTLDRES